MLAPVDLGGTNPILETDAAGRTGRLQLWAGFMRAGGRSAGGRPATTRTGSCPSSRSAARSRPDRPSTTRLPVAVVLLRVQRPARDPGHMPLGDDMLSGLALVDPVLGTAWIGADGVVAATGDPVLLDQAAALVVAWERGRCPPPSAWRCWLRRKPGTLRGRSWCRTRPRGRSAGLLSPAGTGGRCRCRRTGWCRGRRSARPRPAARRGGRTRRCGRPRRPGSGRPAGSWTAGGR